MTSDIQESIETDPMIFPFKTKGILLAASQYERLERNRYKITPENRSIEGILDGGHNTLAIGLYILQRAMEARGLAFPRGQKTWDEFKTLWRQNTDSVHAYLEELKKETNDRTLDFYIPAELLVPGTRRILPAWRRFGENCWRSAPPETTTSSCRFLTRPTRWAALRT